MASKVPWTTPCLLVFMISPFFPKVFCVSFSSSCFFWALYHAFLSSLEPFFCICSPSSSCARLFYPNLFLYKWWIWGPRFMRTKHASCWHLKGIPFLAMPFSVLGFFFLGYTWQSYHRSTSNFYFYFFQQI